MGLGVGGGGVCLAMAWEDVCLDLGGCYGK